MGIGASLFLFAIGAILTFAVNISDTQGINVHTIGIILMVVGAVGMLMSMVFWSSWGGFGGARRSTYVEGPAVAARTRTTTIDEL